MQSRRKFTKDFKLDAVQRIRAGEPAGVVARSLEVSRQELYRWSACRTTAPAAGRQWRRTVYQQIEREMKAGTPITIRRMCALTRVSRAGFYRRGVISEAASVELRDHVQRVALEWPT